MQVLEVSLYRDTRELDRSHDVFTRKTGFGAAVEYRADHVERLALQTLWKFELHAPRAAQIRINRLLAKRLLFLPQLCAVQKRSTA